MTTRSCYYHNVNGRAGGLRQVQRTRAFIRRAAASLLPENSFFGIELTPWVAFQARRSRGKYYAELLESKTFDITWTRCQLPKLLQLIDAAWESSDATSFMANAARVDLQWRKRNIATHCCPHRDEAPHPQNAG